MIHSALFKAGTTHRRRGFTLVEMLIAIAIIAVLAALTVTATVVLAQRSEVTQTESTLRLLDVALQGWQRQSDRLITWGADGSPYPNAVYEMKLNTPHVFTLTEVLRACRNSEEVKGVLAQIDPKFIYTYDSSIGAPPWLRIISGNEPDPNAGNALSSFNNGDWDGELAILDAWGNPIRAIHSGRIADYQAFGDLPANTDPDGTVQLTGPFYGLANGTGEEEIYGTVHNRRIRFVSAGPDGEFGNLSFVHTAPIHELAEDNLYSYPVEDVH